MNFQFTAKWGSGYPGDAVTKKFLQDNLNPTFGFPSIVRFSWKTAENLLNDKGIQMTFEDPEPEEDETASKNPSLKNFFVQLPSAKDKKMRSNSAHPYFKERGLTSTVSF